MPEQKVYIHNSVQKEFIRNEWLKFAKDILGEKEGLDIILFPAEEMQELYFYKQNGLVSWELTETGNFNITKGKIICFEKKTTIFKLLKTKLVGATVESSEIGSYLRQKYQGIMAKTSKVFPVDVINLDYDGNLSKNKTPIDEVTELIFKYQALHSKNFSLFMTWPETENEDEDEYKYLLKKTIKANLNDPRAINFKELFNNSFKSIEDLDYDNLSVIGIIKIIIAKSTNFSYNLYKNDFYIYGGTGTRKKMYSILLNFEYNKDRPTHELYSENVEKSLTLLKI